MFIIHNRYFYLDRKWISWNQNGLECLQSWLSKPLLSSLAEYVMVSAWKMDDTITVLLTAVEMCGADRCLPWQWQFFPKLEMSRGGWHCSPACWAASWQPKSVAALGTRWQHHPAGACSAGPWRQQRQATTLTETHGLPTLMCPQIWHFGGKNWESLLVAEFAAAVCWELAAPPRELSCLGVLGSLKRVLSVYRLPGWKYLLGLSCTFTRANSGESEIALEIWEKLKAEERLDSLSLYTDIYDLTQLRLCPFMRCGEGGFFCLRDRNCGHSDTVVTGTAAEPLSLAKTWV